MHLHVHNHSDCETKELLRQILKNQDIMANELDEIKAGLDAANAKVDKIRTEVASLHDTINSGNGDAPTPEQWQEVKDKVGALNTKLQEVDDQTEDQTAEQPQ
jgi:predicted nuclease with TOPRIM domain